MKIDSKFSHRPLNENLAVEKGVEFFFELLFYVLVIGVPLYEVRKMYTDAQAKDTAMNEKLDSVGEDLALIIKKK